VNQALSSSRSVFAPTTGAALLIDGENISADHCKAVMDVASEYGEPTIRRVYGNVQQIAKWEAIPGLRVIHTSTGKNVTDMMLVIDAMALVLEGGLRTVIIASSDRDFRHLADNLRERGVTVIGVGEHKASAVFRAACTRFVELKSEALTLPALPKAPRPEMLDAMIRDLIATQPGGRIRVAALNVLMYHQHGIKISTYPQKTWRAYLGARANLFVCDPRGPDAAVRLA
jgi:hypothetical protein